MGNALVVGVVEKVGEELKKRMWWKPLMSSVTVQSL
jgi:hypothetical protein